MNDGAATVPPRPDVRKGRGRPQAGPHAHRQRIERLQAELRDAQAVMRQADEKRAAVVGAGAIRHAQRNAEFARALASALNAEVKAKADRAAIADLLQGV